ncbi:MAG: hypothetical protein GEU75_10350 [Dehalococcoidia bacterium]|nr:hypothetical protein [Dehalococcoidia bacterium]
MGLENILAVVVIAGLLLYIAYRRMGTRLNGEDETDDLARFEGPAGLRERQGSADPYQAAADQANYRNYRG